MPALRLAHGGVRHFHEHPEVWVDPMTGNLLEPAMNSSILERDRFGKEKRVYRSLPNNQWLSYSHNGIIERSEKAL